MSREIRKIGIGMLGYAFMGKAHSHAWNDIPIFFWPPPAIPELIIIYGRTEEKVKNASLRFRFKKYTTDWKEVIKDPEVEIVDNCLPNHMHKEPTIAAFEEGKHVVVEKPLARNSKEAKEIYEAFKRARVKAMVAFNYRFVPAVVLARELINKGFLGKVYHFRARYLQDWIVDPNFPLVWRLRKELAGSGPLGDLGSHIVDLARFLIGEPKSVTGMMKTFIEERPLPEDPTKKGKVTVEDAFVATVEFENGAIGTLEASRFATGRKNYNNFEINGEKGSIEFNLERPNELYVYWKDSPVKEIEGWSYVLVTEAHHPYIKYYWPPGHVIGWEHTFLNELHHFLDAVVNDKDIAPWGATIEDGYKNMVILDAIAESATTGKKVTITY